MSNTQDDKAERLRLSRAEKFESPTEAARAIGVEPPTYLGHENGSRGFHTSAQRYADFFGVNLEWLLTGRGSMKSTHPSVPIESNNKSGERDLSTPVLNIQQWPRDVPILGGASCGEDGLFEMNGQTLGFAKRPPTLMGAKDVYALYIYGHSMAPWRDNGGLVYVHPHQPVKINDYVVVQLNPVGSDATPPSFIKRLVKRNSEKLVLHQYNPSEERAYAVRRIKFIHRVVDWDELIGL